MSALSLIKKSMVEAHPDVVLVGAFHEMVILLQQAGHQLKGYVDRQSVDHSLLHEVPYLGNDEDFLASVAFQQCSNVVVTPDLPLIRKKIMLQYEAAGAHFPTIIGGVVMPTAELADGVVLQALSYVSASSSIGCGVKLNVGATVMHDCRVGDYSTLAPRSLLLGGVMVGSEVYIGANATVLPGVSIGDGAVIGAGAVVTKDVPSQTTVKGIPAK